MSAPHPTRDRWRLALASVVTIVAAVGHARLPLEVKGESMVSTGSPALAAARRAREREFGGGRTLLATFEGADAGEVRAWLARAEQLTALPEIATVDVLPVPGGAAGDGLGAIQLTLGADAELDAPLRELRATAGPERSADLAITGAALAEDAIARALAGEQRRIVPTILGVFALLLYAIYRRASLVLAILAPGLGGLVWSGGIQYACGLAVHPISALLAPVVLTVGVAGAVHVVERYLDLLRERTATDAETPADDVPGEAVRGLRRPLLLTTLTTVAGFLAVSANPIPAVREFGLLAALGTALALLWTLALVPSWLRLTRRRGAHARSRPGVSPGPVGSPVDGPGGAWRLWEPTARALRIASTAIVGGTALVTLFFAWRGLDADVDTDPLRILPAEHAFRRATDRVAELVGGVTVVDLLAPPPLAADAPARFRALAESLQAESLVSSLTGMPRVSEQGSALVGILLRPGGTAERARLFERIEARANELGFAGARITGPAARVARDSEALVHGQRRSLAAMFVLVFTVMALGFRSVRLGLLGLVPNVVPCALLYGSLALARRPLSVATTMIATVLLGLIVDNTIHFLHGYGVARKRGSARSTAVAASLRHCARAILITSLVLALGFGAGAVGTLTTTVEFALLSAVTIVLALLCDLVVLPAVLLLRVRDDA